jgi:hypothetical protein
MNEKLWKELGRQLAQLLPTLKIYDREGKPIDMITYSKLHHDRDYAVIDREVATMDPLAEVSTVWLGVDHSWMEEGPPLIFETKVFGGHRDGDQDRYSTEEEARKGHAEMVAKLRKEARKDE